MDNVKLDKFYQEMFADQNFKDSFIKLLEENQEKNSEKRFDIILKELIIPYAKKHNYNITENDIESYELHKIQELSEEDLENIAGGWGPTTILSSIVLLVTMPLGVVSNLFPNTKVGQNLKTVGEIAAVKYVTNKVDDFNKTAKIRYVKNAIGDTVGAYGPIDAIKKAYNYAKGTVTTPETEESLQERTGLTAAADLNDMGVEYDQKNNVATMTSNGKSGGLGCSTDTLLGYIKNSLEKIRHGAYEDLKRIVLKGFPDVQLGGTSPIPIVWKDSNGVIKSVRIPSSKNEKFNFVYYPETEQMYVAGSGTPTITQSDLDLIKNLGNLAVPISQINMWGWKSFFPGFRQQLNFDENLKNKWKNINDTFGNYQYFNKEANDQAKDYKKNLEKYNALWFKDKLEENGPFIDKDGTLTLNFKDPISSTISLDNETIGTLTDRCKFIQKKYRDFNNQIRLNFVKSKPNVNIRDNSITQITTSIIKDNYKLDDKDKFTRITTEKFIGENKVIIDHDNNITTVKIKGNINIQEIKNLNPSSLEFDNFKAIKYSDGYVYIEPLDNTASGNIDITDVEMDAISKIFTVSEVYSKKELNCNWTKNWGPLYWKYSKK